MLVKDSKFMQCKNMVRHCQLCIVFWPNLTIASLNIPNCLSHGRLTFLKRCYWCVGQESEEARDDEAPYIFLYKPEQKHG